MFALGCDWVGGGVLEEEWGVTVNILRFFVGFFFRIKTMF